MGAAVSSVPDWMNPKGHSAAYDQWGFIPSGTAPQHNTSQNYVEGFPDLGGMKILRDGGAVSGADYPSKWIGQPNDRLQSWHTNANNNDYYVSNGIVGNPNVWRGAQFPDVIFDTKINPNWAPGSETVNPLTYPNGSLQQLRENAIKYNPYTTKTWASMQNVPSNEPDWTPIAQAGYGGEVTVMDVWLDTIERHVTAYSKNEYTGLAEVNSSDTSTYDPCAGNGFIDVLVPVLTGGAAVLTLVTFGDELFVFVSDDVRSIILSGVFAAGFFIGRATISLSNVAFGEPSSVESDTANAASAVCLAIGGAAGQYYYDQNGGGMYFPVGGAILANSLLSGFIYRRLIPEVALASGLLFLPGLLTKFVRKVFCWLSMRGITACDDFGENQGGTTQGKEDRRRWDVPSLCAMLTDKVIQSEYLSRDDERAKYIYRGLLMHPFWMQAATRSKDKTMWEDPYSINPIGEILQAHATNVSTQQRVDTMEWGQQWAYDVTSFTGKNDGSNLDSYTATNMFACQNFDILFNADECVDANDPNSPGDPVDPNAPACAGNKDRQAQRDQLLAQNMKAWAQALLESSQNPANISKQFAIPGYATGNPAFKPTRPPLMYSIQTFLMTCSNDYDGSNNTGFDDITQRAEFAAQYLSQSNIGSLTGAQIMTVEANMTMNTAVFPTLSAAWQWVQGSWNEQNVTAYAFYITERRGYVQQDSFDAWNDMTEEVEKWKLEHPINRGFALQPLVPTDPIGRPQPTELNCVDLLVKVKALVDDNHNFSFCAAPLVAAGFGVTTASNKLVCNDSNDENATMLGFFMAVFILGDAELNPNELCASFAQAEDLVPGTKSQCANFLLTYPQMKAAMQQMNNPTCIANYFGTPDPVVPAHTKLTGLITKAKSTYPLLPHFKPVVPSSRYYFQPNDAVVLPGTCNTKNDTVYGFIPVGDYLQGAHDNGLSGVTLCYGEPSTFVLPGNNTFGGATAAGYITPAAFGAGGQQGMTVYEENSNIQGYDVNVNEVACANKTSPNQINNTAFEFTPGSVHNFGATICEN